MGLTNKQIGDAVSDALKSNRSYQERYVRECEKKLEDARRQATHYDAAISRWPAEEGQKLLEKFLAEMARLEITDIDGLEYSNSWHMNATCKVKGVEHTCTFRATATQLKFTVRHATKWHRMVEVNIGKTVRVHDHRLTVALME